MADSNSNLNIVVKVRDEASAALSRMSGDVSDLGGSLNFAGDKAGILAGALAAIGSTAVLKGAIEAFIDSEAAMAKFDAILKTLPPNLKALRGTILDLADNALIKFGFSNEEAALSIARLLQTTKNQDFAFKSFQAAMDLARYKGISLEEATQALILAFQGGGRLLKQFGIEVDDHASKETILAAVMATTAGQAEAYAQTTKGAISIIMEIFGEFSEMMGSIFKPAIMLARDTILGFIESNGGLAATIKLLQPVVVGLATFFGGAFVAGTILAIGSVIAMIGASAELILALVALSTVVTAFVTLWQDNWAQAKAILELFKIGAMTIWSSLTGYLSSQFAGAMNSVRAQLQSVVDFFNSVVSIVTQPIKTAIGAVGTVGKAIGFADGGIVTRPTLAMVGEGGESEAIIPLSKLNGIGGGGGVNIYLQGDFYTTTEIAEKFGNEMARIIKNQLNLAIRA